jgi:hypothetical protein
MKHNKVLLYFYVFVIKISNLININKNNLSQVVFLDRFFSFKFRFVDGSFNRFRSILFIEKERLTIIYLMKTRSKM